MKQKTKNLKAMMAIITAFALMLSVVVFGTHISGQNGVVFTAYAEVSTANPDAGRTHLPPFGAPESFFGEITTTAGTALEHGWQLAERIGIFASAAHIDDGDNFLVRVAAGEANLGTFMQLGGAFGGGFRGVTVVVRPFGHDRLLLNVGYRGNQGYSSGAWGTEATRYRIDRYDPGGPLAPGPSPVHGGHARRRGGGRRRRRPVSRRRAGARGDACGLGPGRPRGRGRAVPPRGTRPGPAARRARRLRHRTG